SSASSSYVSDAVPKSSIRRRDMDVVTRDTLASPQVTRSPLEGSHLLRHRLIQLVNYAILIWLAVVTAFPLFWTIITSVKDRRDVFSTFLPKSIDLSNYGRIWTGLDLPHHLLNSVFVTGLTVSIVVLTVTLAAYAFARLEFPGREILFYVFLA